MSNKPENPLDWFNTAGLNTRNLVWCLLPYQAKEQVWGEIWSPVYEQVVGEVWDRAYGQIVDEICGEMNNET